MKTIELRRTKTIFPSLPDPAIARDCLYIKSPFNKDLVEAIKVIDWRQRKYERDGTPPVWMVVEEDLDQKPDEPTNLQYIRRICAAAAKAEGWQFLDYTEKAEEEIAAQVAQAEQEDLEAHVAAVCAILPMLPAHSLKIASWGRTVIKLQLVTYIDTELWHQLKDACTKVWKPAMLVMGAGQRFDFSFVFEMAADPRIVKALLACKIKNLKVHSLRYIDTYGDCVAHFSGDNSELWMGSPIEQSDLSAINWGSQPWELAKANGTIYWVANVKEFVTSWLDESAYFVVFRAVLPKSASTLEKALTENHIEHWFRGWGSQILATQEFKLAYASLPYHKESWTHPAAALISHIRRFKSTSMIHMLGMNETEFNWRVDEINNLKESRAAAAREEAQKTAIATVVAQLQKESKDTLLRLAGDRAKPSWPKTKIAESFVTQEYAEKKLQIY